MTRFRRAWSAACAVRPRPRRAHLRALADGAGLSRRRAGARRSRSRVRQQRLSRRLALRERDALRALVARGPRAVLDESEALARAVERCRRRSRGNGRACARPSAAPRWPSRWPTSPACGPSKRSRARSRFSPTPASAGACVSAARGRREVRACRRATARRSKPRPGLSSSPWANTAPTSSIIRAISISSSSTTRNAFPSARRATRAPPPSTSCKGWSSCSPRPPPTATCSASICGCAPTPAPRRSRSPPKPPKRITKGWARIGSAPR